MALGNAPSTVETDEFTLCSTEDETRILTRGRVMLLPQASELDARVSPDIPLLRTLTAMEAADKLGFLFAR
jgi:hypothetical protein